MAYAINNDGTVVGERSFTDEVWPRSAFVWSKEGGFVDLGIMNGPASAATGVSPSGVILGATGLPGEGQAFLYDHGRIEFLGPVPGATMSSPGGINVVGQVTASGFVADRAGTPLVRAFRWDDGTWTALLPLPGYEGSCAGEDIGAGGQIVGECGSPRNPNSKRAVLWSSRAAIDLTALIKSERFVLARQANAINGRGLEVLAEGWDERADIVTLILSPERWRAADLNGDCVVEEADLVILLDHWDIDGSAADLDGSGTVGFGDLLLLLVDWG
jgi:probable HAF family extracellular repeat protein